MSQADQMLYRPIYPEKSNFNIFCNRCLVLELWYYTDQQWCMTVQLSNQGLTSRELADYSEGECTKNVTYLAEDFLT